MIILFAKRFRHHRRNKKRNIRAIIGYFFGNGGAQKSIFQTCRKKQRVNIRSNAVIRLGNLHLRFKIRHCTETANNQFSAILSGKINRQSLKCLHCYIRKFFRRLLKKGEPFFHGKQRLFCLVHQYPDNQFIHYFRSTLNNIQMTICNRVKTPRINCSSHIFFHSVNLRKGPTFTFLSLLTYHNKIR